MPLSCKRIWCRNLPFTVCENVYEPAEDTFLFSENIDVGPAMIVLDIGTGCGILGVIAAQKARQVVAVDVNPCAIRCALTNARLNKVSEKMLFIQGDLMSPINPKQQFDRIFFNAPYLPTEPRESVTWLSRAWDGGVTGREIIDRFISSVHKYLKNGGKILLMQSTLVDVDKTIETFAQVGLSVGILAKLNLPFFETLLLLQATRSK
jgi:release factor glutamine methyltransferase